MRFVAVRRWPALLALALLLSALAPPIALAQPDPPEESPEANSQNTPCTGSTTADYVTDPCGPSLSIPAWNDASGWNNTAYADTIKLFDLNGDGKDELLGVSQQGLKVNSWSEAWGQWVPAGDPNKPLPFGNGSVNLSTVRYGRLTPSLAGAVALSADGSGLETWTWSSGDGSPASGFWTQVAQTKPLANNSFETDWLSNPSYYSTLQFVPGGFGDQFGVIGRSKVGIVFCYWNSGDSAWLCYTPTTAFADDDVTDQAADGPAAYYYDTIQLADIYDGAAGPELIGRARTSNGGALQVYTFDSFNTGRFQPLSLSGLTPFDATWNNVAYASTIKPAQLTGAAVQQIVGRGSNGLQWWMIEDSSCGGHAAPCWKNMTAYSGLFSDHDGYNQAEYYATIQFADIDADGVDEALARNPQHGFGIWDLHTNSGWSQVAAQPALTSGTKDDPLWSNASYYATIQTGNFNNDNHADLLARGKYGIRTWTWNSAATPAGFNRPLPYGFSSFATTAEDNAFTLLNNYLAIAEGNDIRDSYTSLNTPVMTNYQDCLTDSIISGATMPPATTCELVGPETPLSNPNNVTADDWKSMVEAIQQEVAMAEDVDGHFNQSVAAILNDLYVLNQADFDQMVQALFPADKPGGGVDIFAIFQDLFWGFAEGLASLVPDGVGSAIVDPISGVITAISSIQTGGGTDTSVQHLQTDLATNAGLAIEQSNAFFGYVAQDGGLLNLYGTLISDQVWEIQQSQHDTAIATGEFTTAKWMYQTLLPHKWGIWVCGEGQENVQYCDELGDTPRIGENAVKIPTDHDYTAFLSETIEVPAAVSSGNGLYKKLFDQVQADCPLTAGAAGAWNYNNCNMGFKVDDLLLYEDGWNLPCTVATQISENSYQCPGEGLPPRGYPPKR